MAKVKKEHQQDEEQRQRIVKARAQLIMGHPFFGTLSLGMSIKEDPKIKTGSTNGKQLRYNADFVRGMRQSQVLGFVAHETAHPAFLHHLRRNGRNKRKWNAACDYAINGILVEAGFDLPDGGLVDPSYKGKSAEEIYSLLPADWDKNIKGPMGWDTESEDPGGCGGVDDAEDCETAEERDHQEAMWKIQVASAAQAAKQQGKLPAGLERFIEELMKVRTPWRQILRRFITEKAKDDFSWAKVNRRYVSQDLYLPSAYSETMGEIVVVIDTSGSIGQAELSMFGGELNKIRVDAAPRKVHVIYCDAAVNKYEMYGPEDMIELKAVGGGGTDFRPPFKYVDKKGIEPKCLVYLTDMYGTFPDQPPEYPTLWASFTPDTKAPFGDVVSIDRAEALE